MIDTEKELNNIKEIVKSLLETDEKCRSSDKWLTIRVLRQLGFKIYVDYHELDSMPSWETIRRTRQKIQETEPNLRPEEEIQRIREERQEEFKEYFSRKTRGIECISNSFKPRGTVEVFEK